MKQSVIDRADAALDGMREIVRAEMLVKGAYIEDEVSNPVRAERKAICGGRRACAIGSLWLGAGIKPKLNDVPWGPDFELPGTQFTERDQFLSRRPALKLAYNALNEAASEFAAKNVGRVYVSHRFTAPIEALFEGSYGAFLDKKDLLKIIAAAKRKVKAQAK